MARPSFINAVSPHRSPDAPLPQRGNSDHTRILLDNARVSKKELVAAGFEETCSWIAGVDSGSSWIHSDGRRAEILVRHWNLISITREADVAREGLS